MTSVTIGYTARELRHPRTIGNGETERTIRVRTGRGNSRRQAIAESYGRNR